MGWKTLQAYITGSVDAEILQRNDYLFMENHLLRQQITGLVRLSDGERATLAEIGKGMGKQALAEVATIVTPEIILVWHRQLIAMKFDGSKPHKALERPKIDQDLEMLVAHMARENRFWGYDRIVGAVDNLDYRISDQMVGNILLPTSRQAREHKWSIYCRERLDGLLKYYDREAA
jgi:putative transposase